MNRGQKFFRKLRWTGMLALLLLATYPMGFYFNLRRWYEQVQLNGWLPKKKWAAAASRVRVPRWGLLNSQRGLPEV